jgi:H+-transporting ATPase
MGLLWFGLDVLHLDVGEVQTFIFLKLAVSGHLTLFVVRSRQALWRKPWPAPSLLWSAIGTKALATLFVVFPFGLITPIGWGAVGLIWAYSLFWALIEDRVKLVVYRHLDRSAPRHSHFLSLLHRPVFRAPK